MSARRLPIGKHVVVRVAGGDLWKGTLYPVPLEWRDATGREDHTTRGSFPKRWVRIEGHPRAVPYPTEDVLTELPGR